LKISERLGAEREIGMSCNNIGLIYLNKGELNRALVYFQKSFEISKKLDDKRWLGMAYGNIGLVYQYKGEMNESLYYYKKYLMISEEIGDKQGIGSSCKNIGRIYLEIYNFDKALNYFKKAEKIFKVIGDKVNLSDIYNNLSELNIEKGSYYKGKIFAHKALSYARETGAIPQEVYALSSLGKALSKDNPEQGISYLKEAIAISRNGKMKLVTAKLLSDLAEIILENEIETESVKSIKEYLNEAEKKFRKIGSKSDIENVRNLLKKVKL
jgi:tetratricopeptide (TPR) repeat protein